MTRTRQFLGSIACGLAALSESCSNSPTDVEADAGAVYQNQRPQLRTPGVTLAYIANRNSDTVTVVDLDSFEVVGSAPVGRDPVDLDGPRHFVLDADRGVGYVLFSYPESNLGPHATALGDNGRAGYVGAYSLDDLSPLGDARVNVSPGDIALSDSKRALAVSHYDQLRGLMSEPEARRANIALIAPAVDVTKTRANVLEHLACAVPAALAFGQNDSRIFVACTGEDSLTVLDAESGDVLSRVQTGEFVVDKPYALVRNAAGDRLLISNQVARSVVMFSTDDTPVPLSTAKVASVPFFAEFLDEQEYVVALQDPDGAARIDVESGTVLATTTYDPALCTKPSAFKRTADGRLFLVCEGDHHEPGALVRVDPQSLVGSDRLELGVYPERIEILSP